MSIWRIGAVAGILALAAVLALGLRRDPHDIRSATVGKPAPAFDLPRLGEEGRVRLADLRGKTVIVNFFASWCLPCREEHPALVRAWERYRTSDVVIVGILYQDDPQSGLDFTRRLGGGWPSATDPDGRTAIAYGVFGIPESFFISPDGLIARRHVGPLDERSLIAAIEAIRTKR